MLTNVCKAGPSQRGSGVEKQLKDHGMEGASRTCFPSHLIFFLRHSSHARVTRLRFCSGITGFCGWSSASSLIDGEGWSASSGVWSSWDGSSCWPLWPEPVGWTSAVWEAGDAMVHTGGRNHGGGGLGVNPSRRHGLMIFSHPKQKVQMDKGGGKSVKSQDGDDGGVLGVAPAPRREMGV